MAHQNAHQCGTTCAQLRRIREARARCIILQRTLLGFWPYGTAGQCIKCDRCEATAERRARPGRESAQQARAQPARDANRRASMTAQQRIVRVRRNYNQWVANQTLEDYALRFTAKSARKWSSARVANTAIGAVSFLALEAIGGSIAINYGFVNATAAILIVGALIFLTCVPIAYYASTYGVDIDLLTRGAGLRLHRLDHHVADLRVVHVPVLRDRSGDHVARAGDVLRHSPVRRLHHQLAGRHSAGHARHHVHQPLPGLDAAVLDRSCISLPFVFIAFYDPQLVSGVDAVPRHRRDGRRRPSTSCCSAPHRPSCSR